MLDRVDPGLHRRRPTFRLLRVHRDPPAGRVHRRPRSRAGLRPARRIVRAPVPDHLRPAGTAACAAASRARSAGSARRPSRRRTVRAGRSTARRAPPAGRPAPGRTSPADPPRGPVTGSSSRRSARAAAGPSAAARRPGLAPRLRTGVGVRVDQARQQPALGDQFGPATGSPVHRSPSAYRSTGSPWAVRNRESGERRTGSALEGLMRRGSCDRFARCRREWR